MLMLLSSYHVEATSKKLQADLSPRKKVVEYPHSESCCSQMEMLAIKLNTMKKNKVVRTKWVVIGCRIMQREQNEPK